MSTAAQARVRHRHTALPELRRRRVQDRRGHPGATGHREGPHAPGAAGAGNPSGASPWPGATSGLTLPTVTVQPLRALLVVAGAATPFDVELHQALGYELNRLAQHVDVGSPLGELGQCIVVVVIVESPRTGWWVAPQPYPGPRWPPLAGWPPQLRGKPLRSGWTYTTSGDLPKGV